MASHTGHRQRMKAEFLARGIEGWPDHRVLELLLFYSIPQGDVNGLAHDLIEQFGSLSGVLDASVEELRKVKGVGEHTAVLLRMLPALLGRYQASRTRLSDIINSADDAYPWLEPYFFGARNEMVYVLCLDGKRQVLGVRKVAEGSIEMAEMNARRIAEEAMGLRAARWAPRPILCWTTSPRTLCCLSTRATSPCPRCGPCTTATGPERIPWWTTASVCPAPTTTGR